MDEKKYIKAKLALKQMTMSELAEKMSELSGKKYTRDSINGKFYRESLSVKEMKLIAKILNFTIEYKNDNL